MRSPASSAYHSASSRDSGAPRREMCNRLGDAWPGLALTRVFLRAVADGVVVGGPYRAKLPKQFPSRDGAASPAQLPGLVV